MKKAPLLLVALLLILSAPTARGEELTLSFVGDCSIGEAIQYRDAEQGYTATLAEKGMDWPFSLVRDILEADDFTFANLEVVFTRRTAHESVLALPLAGPPQNAQALLYSGIDGVNTVNNHCGDFYIDGYLDTVATLNALNFPYFGSVYLNKNIPETDTLMIREVKGVRIGALGFSFPREINLGQIGRRIQALREAGCQLVIMSIHWGTEKHEMPDLGQPEFAKQLIDLGADVVWGHHPHVLQPVQFYNGGVVMYSTGNFTFGTAHPDLDKDTGIFQLTYELGGEGPALKAFRVIPCQTAGMGDFRPRELTEEQDRQRVFKKLLFKGRDHGLTSLPASFLDTGTVLLQDGLPAE